MFLYTVYMNYSGINNPFFENSSVYLIKEDFNKQKNSKKTVFFLL